MGNIKSKAGRSSADKDDYFVRVELRNGRLGPVKRRRKKKSKKKRHLEAKPASPHRRKNTPRSGDGHTLSPKAQLFESPVSKRASTADDTPFAAFVVRESTETALVPISPSETAPVQVPSKVTHSSPAPPLPASSSLEVRTNSSFDSTSWGLPSPATDSALERTRRRRRRGKSTRPKSNAFQIRLEKARAKQTALLPLTSSSTDSSTASHQDDLNVEFDATWSSGVIWEQVQRDAPISAVALSRDDGALRSMMALGRSPILLAIGTEDGLVTVTEILDDKDVCVSNLASLADLSGCAKHLGVTRELCRKGRKIRCLDFSTDGKVLAFAFDCTVCLVRLKLERADQHRDALVDIEVLCELERVDRIYAVQFSPDGQLLAVGGYDSTVTIVRITCHENDTQLEVISEIPRKGLVLALDWSPDGRFLAVGGSDKSCAIVDNAWKVVRETQRPSSIQALKWSPDGTRLALGDRRVAVLQSETLQLICDVDPCGSDDTKRGTTHVNSVLWSPDAAYMAIGGSDGHCVIIETQGFVLVCDVDRLMPIISMAWGQQKAANCEFVGYLAIASDCSVALMKTGSEVDGASSVSYSEASSAASGSLLSCESDWSTMENQNCDTNYIAASPAREKTPTSRHQLSTVAFSPLSGSDGTVYLVHANEVGTVSVRRPEHNWSLVNDLHMQTSIRSIAFSLKHRYLALGGDNGDLLVISVPSGSVIAHLKLGAAISSLAFSYMGERLAVGSTDGSLALFGPGNGWELLGEIDTSDESILSIDLSKRHLAIGREDGTVTVHETEQVFGNFYVPQVEISRGCPVNSVKFGGGGRALAVGTSDGKVGIFSGRGGNWIMCHEIVSQNPILCINWSPSGRYIAVTGTQSFVVVETCRWQEIDGVRQATCELLDGTNRFSSTHWSSDGKWIALAKEGGEVYILSARDWRLTRIPANSLFDRTVQDMKGMSKSIDHPTNESYYGDLS